MKTNIRKIRVSKCVSVKTLADAAGVSPMSIYRYETAHRMPDILVAAKIAKALGCTVDELIGRKAG